MKEFKQGYFSGERALFGTKNARIVDILAGYLRDELKKEKE